MSVNLKLEKNNYRERVSKPLIVGLEDKVEKNSEKLKHNITKLNADLQTTMNNVGDELHNTLTCELSMYKDIFENINKNFKNNSDLVNSLISQKFDNLNQDLFNINSKINDVEAIKQRLKTTIKNQEDMAVLLKKMDEKIDGVMKKLEEFDVEVEPQENILENIADVDEESGEDCYEEAYNEEFETSE